jgi:hypothetical protein
MSYQKVTRQVRINLLADMLLGFDTSLFGGQPRFAVVAEAAFSKCEAFDTSGSL